MPTHDEHWWANPRVRAILESDPHAILRDRGLNVPADLPLAIVHEFVRVVSLLWVDGQILPLDRFYIDPSDYGLLFGRGAWESTRTVGGVPWLWPLHLDRLLKTAATLGIELTSERLPSAAQVAEYVRTLTTQDIIIRLNVSAGRPGRPGLVWMSAAAQPMPVTTVRLKTCPSPVQKGQAYLTLKTFQYATRLQIGQLAARSGFDSALLLDVDDNLLEAAHANIFVRLADGWATPKSDGGLLPGTVRKHLLEFSPLPIRERVIPLAAVAEAREVFLTNSNVGIVAVTQIDNHSFPVGNETAMLSKWLEPQGQSGVQYRFRERPTNERSA